MKQISSTALAEILILALDNLSPYLTELFQGLLSRLEESAAKSETPWDDIFVKLLKILISPEEK